jgi:hypothetical protein
VQYFDFLVSKASATNPTAARAAVILSPLIFEAFGFWGLLQGLLRNSTSVVQEAIVTAVVVALTVAYAVVYVSVKMLYDE